MARTRVITRTIKTTLLTVLLCNTSTATAGAVVIEVAGAFKSEKDALKTASKLLDNEENRAVKIVAMEEREQLYECSEQEYLEIAHPIPSRNKKETEEGDNE